MTDTIASVDAWADWKRPARRGALIGAVTFGVFGGWAALAPLGSAVMTHGMVTVDGGRVVVQHLEGGIVSDLRIEEGSMVSAGEVIMEVGRAETPSSLFALQDQKFALSAEEARLRAEIDDTVDITFPTGLPQRLASMQSDLFRKNLGELIAQEQILDSQIEQLKAQTEGNQERLNLATAQISSFDAELKSIEPLVAAGTITAARHRDIERGIREWAAQETQLRSEIIRLDAAILETSHKRAQVRSAHKREAAARLAEIELELSTVTERIIVAEDALKRSIVTAPASGRVIGLAVTSAGQVVGPGAPILEIVPSNETLTIKSRISPMDIGNVSAGMQAEVRFPALAAPNLPMLMGEVTAISGDAMIDERSGASFYELTISIPEASTAGEALALAPGMPAEAIVLTGERTALQYLVQPLADAIRAGMRER